MKKSIIEQEAERLTIGDYLSKGRFGGVSKASGGVITSKKLYDFDTIKNGFIKYLTSIKFGVKKAK